MLSLEETCPLPVGKQPTIRHGKRLATK